MICVTQSGAAIWPSYAKFVELINVGKCWKVLRSFVHRTGAIAGPRKWIDHSRRIGFGRCKQYNAEHNRRPQPNSLGSGSTSVIGWKRTCCLIDQQRWGKSRYLLGQPFLLSFCFLPGLHSSQCFAERRRRFHGEWRRRGLRIFACGTFQYQLKG